MSNNVIWITGLSASGKTTLAKIVTMKLRNNNYPVVMLDGDQLRDILGASKRHSQAARKTLAHQYSHLVQTISQQGIIVVIATVALFKEVHDWNRENIPGYFEVFLDVPIVKLKERDPKGLYKMFDQGKINNLAGLDLHVDFPSNPDLCIKFNRNNDPEYDANLLMESFNIFVNLKTKK
jgi:adenylylsulfate kinase-like enzyme